MHGAPNDLRITWQFFEKDFLATDAFKHPRNFSLYDEKYMTHFNIRISEVSDRYVRVVSCRCMSFLSYVSFLGIVSKRGYRWSKIGFVALTSHYKRTPVRTCFC